MKYVDKLIEKLIEKAVAVCFSIAALGIYFLIGLNNRIDALEKDKISYGYKNDAVITRLNSLDQKYDRILCKFVDKFYCGK